MSMSRASIILIFYLSAIKAAAFGIQLWTIKAAVPGF